MKPEKASYLSQYKDPDIQKQKCGFWSDYYFLFTKFREKPVASQPGVGTGLDYVTGTPAKIKIGFTKPPTAYDLKFQKIRGSDFLKLLQIPPNHSKSLK